MAFQRVRILNLRTYEAVEAMLNPPEYQIEGSANYAEISVPGLPAPPVQYVGGSAQLLRMELLFDTFASHLKGNDRGADVRRFTNKVASLREPDPDLKAPPDVMVMWGTFRLRCVLKDVQQRFTRFQSDGTPVRAVLSVVFKEFVPLPEPEIEPVVDETITRTVEAGETLAHIAAETVGDPAAWRQIATLNEIDDPLRLPAGTNLQVPKPQRSGGLPGV